MENTNTKMTKKDWLARIRAIVEASADEDKGGALQFIDHEVELLDRKSSKSKETKAQKMNAGIKETILEVLADIGKPTTIADLMTDSRLTTYDQETSTGTVTLIMTNQKLSSLVKQLKDEHKVVRTEDKKRAYFSLPDAEIAE